MYNINSDGNPHITGVGFETALTNLPYLETFDLQLPHVQSLDIGLETYNIDGFSVREKGAMFISRNLPGLTKLCIRGNNIG
jgi:hypothetical protein